LIKKILQLIKKILLIQLIKKILQLIKKILQLIKKILLIQLIKKILQLIKKILQLIKNQTKVNHQQKKPTDKGKSSAPTLHGGMVDPRNVNHAKLTSGSLSVYSCVYEFTQPELLTGDNGYRCKTCTIRRNQQQRAQTAAASNDEQTQIDIALALSLKEQSTNDVSTSSSVPSDAAPTDDTTTSSSVPSDVAPSDDDSNDTNDQFSTDDDESSGDFELSGFSSNAEESSDDTTYTSQLIEEHGKTAGFYFDDTSKIDLKASYNDDTPTRSDSPEISDEEYARRLQETYNKRSQSQGLAGRFDTLAAKNSQQKQTQAINAQKKQQKNGSDDALEAFRSGWMQEIETKTKSTPKVQLTDEEIARQLQQQLNSTTSNNLTNQSNSNNLPNQSNSPTSPTIVDGGDGVLTLDLSESMSQVEQLKEQVLSSAATEAKVASQSATAMSDAELARAIAAAEEQESASSSAPSSEISYEEAKQLLEALGDDAPDNIKQIVQKHEAADDDDQEVVLLDEVDYGSSSSSEDDEEEDLTDLVITTATKQFLLHELPQVLNIHIKRFEQSAYGQFRKLSKKVAFPLMLNLGPFMHSGNNSEVTTQPRNQSILYQLVGVVEHSGSLHGGHYIAYAQNRSTGQWYYFSDSFVKQVSEKEVLSAEAYVLFYQKI